MFQLPIQVYYEDTDAGGVVYNANYLRFMERARTEWLRDLGFEQDTLMHELGVIFAVRRAEVDFIKPARFNERLLVSAEVVEQKRASLVFHQEVKRAGDDELLVLGKVRIACISYPDFRPVAVPKMIQERMNAE